MRYTSPALPTSSAQFPSLSLIKDPGDETVVTSSGFQGRRQWVFPALSFSGRGNITSWVFRAVPSTTNWTDKDEPLFLLWQENENTPNSLDFNLISQSEGEVGLLDPSNPGVFQCVLDTPLPVEDGYVFGVRLPLPGPSTLSLAFIRDAPDEFSYYSDSFSSFVSVSPTNSDNETTPLVSPVFGELELLKFEY